MVRCFSLTIRPESSIASPRRGPDSPLDDGPNNALYSAQSNYSRGLTNPGTRQNRRRPHGRIYPWRVPGGRVESHARIRNHTFVRRRSISWSAQRRGICHRENRRPAYHLPGDSAEPFEISLRLESFRPLPRVLPLGVGADEPPAPPPAQRSH